MSRVVLRKEEETNIILSGDWSSPEADRLSSAWFSAIAMEHKLPDRIRYMEGMSGKKYRYLINNLIANTPDARYLEIGSWAGSTACSAMWDNKIKMTCIENWQHFGGPRDQFFDNINFSKNDNVDFTFIESDYENVDYDNIGKFNVYLFDGPHEEEHQYNGIVNIANALDDTYTLIVDDWNWAGVRNGTYNGLEKTNQTIIAKIEIRTTSDEIHPENAGPASDWHNGYFMAVIKKNK